MDSSTFIQLVIKLLSRSQKKLLTVHSLVQEKIWQKIPERITYMFDFRLLLWCFTHFYKNVVFIIFFTVSLLLALSTHQQLCFSSSPRAILKATDFIKSLPFELEYALH